MKQVFFLFSFLIVLTSCARAPQKIYAPTQVLAVAETFSFSSAKKSPHGLIVLDPGHGGDDDGAQSSGKKKMLEKDLTLYTAKRVQCRLEELGYQVVMTRGSDYFVPLHTRAQYANDINPVLFVSIHYNSAPSREAKGIEVYYYESKDNASRSGESKALAKKVLDHVVERTKANRRGVRHGNFHVIRETKMPAILVEGGFMTNEEEMRCLNTPAYIHSLAEGIVLGVDAYACKGRA